MAKKSQMEIMGLLIVVILMILGMLFVVKFIILKPQGNIKQSYADTVLAANLKNSVIFFTTDCRKQDVQTLLKDCVVGGIIDDCPGGTNSCEYAVEKIEEIFDETLNVWNRDYRFEACLLDGRDCTSAHGQIIRLSSGSSFATTCQNQEIESKFSPVKTIQGNMKITLDICRDVV